MTYAGPFFFLVAQEITGDILLELTLESLKELEVNTFGKRFKIHNAILALREYTFGDKEVKSVTFGLNQV